MNDVLIYINGSKVAFHCTTCNGFSFTHEHTGKECWICNNCHEVYTADEGDFVNTVIRQTNKK